MLENPKQMKVGIVIPANDLEQSGEPLSYQQMRNRAQQAEELGFDSIWVYDHLLHRFGASPTVGFRESMTTLSALAEATKGVDLGTLVACTAFRNPAIFAKMADNLEDISDGRLILGLGAGWHREEFDAFGLPFDHLASRFEEALQIIIPLLRDGHVDFKGEFYQALNCELRPHARNREGGPPIMIASVRPRMMKLTAQYADSWNTDWLGPKDYFMERQADLKKACLEVGRDPKTLELTGGVTIAYPNLGAIPSWMTGPDQYHTGLAQEVAGNFQEYANWGVSHIICSVYPHTAESVEELGEAVKVFKSNNLV